MGFPWHIQNRTTKNKIIVTKKNNACDSKTVNIDQRKIIISITIICVDIIIIIVAC